MDESAVVVFLLRMYMKLQYVFWFDIEALSNIPLQWKLSSILKVNN